MAAPNLLSLTTINGKSATLALTTSAASLLSNAAASGKVLKVNTVIVTNIDGTNAADVTLNHYTAAALGGTAQAIASTISVPADSALVLIDKNSSFYLEEDKSLGALASAAGDLVVLISYEDIS